MLSENEDMVPAPGVAGDPPPRTQGPVTPPESGTFKGGAGSPGVQIKGYRALLSQQQWGKGVQAPSTLLLSGEKGRGKSHSIPGKGKLCRPQKLGTGTVLKTCWEKGWSRDHKSFRDQRSRSQQAPVNQTSKSKSPKGEGGAGLGSLGGLAVGRELGPWGAQPRASSPVHDAVTVQSHKVNLAASPRAD